MAGSYALGSSRYPRLYAAQFPSNLTRAKLFDPSGLSW